MGSVMIDYMLFQMDLVYRVYMACGYMLIIMGLLIILWCVMEWTRG